MTKLIKHLIQTEKKLDAANTLFSGQSFMWLNSPCEQGLFYRAIGDNIILIKQLSSDTLAIECKDESINGIGISEFISDYFSLDVDTERIFPNGFSHRYPELWHQLRQFHGVRVMRQEPFETMVTFMCAQGIGMGLIRRQVSMIAERFGRKIAAQTDRGSVVAHAFPSPADLASADIEDLAPCTNNNRIRAANIIVMADAFRSGAMDIDCLRSTACSLDSLRNTLCEHRGIGMKIADCIALFGLGRFDAFPIDTHVKQYLWEWFRIQAAQNGLTEKNYRNMQSEARTILGNDFAGYTGHMLFHCWRREVKRMKAF